MILVGDIVTVWVLDFKISKHIVARFDGPYEGCTEPMVGMSTLDYKQLNQMDYGKM